MGSTRPSQHVEVTTLRLKLRHAHFSQRPLHFIMHIPPAMNFLKFEHLPKWIPYYFEFKTHIFHIFSSWKLFKNWMRLIFEVIRYFVSPLVELTCEPLFDGSFAPRTPQVTNCSAQIQPLRITHSMAQKVVWAEESYLVGQEISSRIQDKKFVGQAWQILNPPMDRRICFHP
jgi:hypothetical protein